MAVGIDLGTTNSVVALSRDSKVEVIRDPGGNALIPSVVAYLDDGRVIVGDPARRELAYRPDTVVSSIKRLMGRGEEDLHRIGGALPYRIASSALGGMVRLIVGQRTLSPVEISADILRAVKNRAEIALDRTVDRAVVTVPAYFDDAARTATRDAARLAGLDVLRLVSEPTAAALAYGLESGAEGLYAVYDLGGGTFDFSLLRLEKGVFQVLATGGDAALGGDDFDNAVAGRFIGERGGGDVSSDELKQALMFARQAREALTDAPSWRGEMELGETNSPHALDRATLEALIAPLVERTLKICAGVLEDAKVNAAELNGVVLVGGATRTPLVRGRTAAFFGRTPLSDINPDEVVAVGAALQAEALTVGSSTLLLDVTPLSLGLETMGGVVEKIIERNTAIPVSKAQEFTTYQDGQQAMAFHIVQGERELVDQCRSLARFELRGIPPMTAGAARIRVSFAVDADGLLTVTASEQTTGVESHIEVKPSYGLTEDEMATMLRDSLTHAREDIERRQLIEAQVEAQRNVDALKGALARDSQVLDDILLSAIEASIRGVEHAIKNDNRDGINDAVDIMENLARPFAEWRMDRDIKAALSGKHVDQVR